MEKKKDHYTSKEAKKVLKVSDCKLMHLREEGRIKAVKKGRSFLYDTEAIKKYKEKSSESILESVSN